MHRTTRRGLLSRVAAVGSVAVAGALAGCGAGGDGGRTTFGVPDRTTSPPETSEEPGSVGTPTTDPPEVVDFGTVDPPDQGPPSFRRWLPAPSEFVGPGEAEPVATDDSYHVWNLDPGRLRGLGDAVPGELLYQARWLHSVGLDHFGIGPYRRVLRLGFDRAVVVEASLDRSAVAGTLLGTGYGDAGRRRGYRLFGRSDDPRAVALGDGALVFANVGHGEDPVDVVRSVVDARTGAVPRFHEERDWFDRLSRTTGWPPMGALRNASVLRSGPSPLSDLDGLVGHGIAFAFEPGVTYQRSTFAFDGAGEPDRRRRALRRYAARFDMDEARAVEVTVGETTAELAAVFPDGHYDDRAGDGSEGSTFPQITWGFDHERTSEEVRVTVTHEAGTEVPEASVRIETSVDAPLPTSFSEGDDAVGPGDAVSFGIPVEGTSPPYRIRLVWEAPDDSTAVLGSYRIGGDPAGRPVADRRNRFHRAASGFDHDGPERGARRCRRPRRRPPAGGRDVRPPGR